MSFLQLLRVCLADHTWRAVVGVKDAVLLPPSVTPLSHFLAWVLEAYILRSEKLALRRK